MCGIAGFVSTVKDPSRAGFLRRMAGAIRHRGPDEEGFFDRPGVGFGIRRLSIVDLAGSHQPISNERGDIHAVFNGEIYNYLEIRDQLLARGHELKTGGDTETLVHLYEDYGTDMLRHLRGMFAFAIWDEPKQLLFVARDRLGKKPLFYTVVDGTLVFCSELAALLEWRGISREIDPAALASYLVFGYVPNPDSILKGIQKLPPAHFMTWQNGEIQIQRYWSLDYSGKLKCGYDEARELVKNKIDESIRLRLRSDVPLGLLLSGGLDSNAILARLSRGLGTKVRTFTIGFAEKQYDESDLARLSAAYFGTEHHELVGSTDLLKLLPDVVRHYGEPFADKSALPSLLVSDLVRSEVKVALNGDGGDEAFGGYAKYRLSEPQKRLSGAIPTALKERWTSASMCGGRIGASKLSRNLRRSFLPETQSLFTTEFFAGSYFGRIATAELRRNTGQFGLLADSFWRGGFDPVDRMLHWDQTHYFVDDLLVKMDIASMARSLEMRSPFADHQLVELCAQIPSEWKIDSAGGKRILRDIVRDDLPPGIMNAKKRGFSVPLERWFRNEAREQLRGGLLPLHEKVRPFLREPALANLLEQHQSGRANHAQRLWALWVLNAWCRHFL
mgnify:CR=1 FL=1